MTISFSAKKLSTIKASSSATVFFLKNGRLPSSTEELDKSFNGVLKNFVSKNTFSAGTIKSLTLTSPGSNAFTSLLFVQVTENKAKACSSKQLKNALKNLALICKKASFESLNLFIDDLDIDSDKPTETFGHCLALEFERAHYRYTQTFSKQEKNSSTLKKVIVDAKDTASSKAIKLGLKSGSAIAHGINTARELGNLPGNHCTPSDLAETAKKMAKNSSKLSVKVLGEAAMEKLNMGSLLSVSKGSTEEAKLIIFEYKGKTTKQPQVLVGKGITFDTGGISLKPGPSMDEMKYDMCGAASVFGAIQALVDLDAKAHVVGIVAAAENMPAGNASKPGDVVSSMSGQTIEILNTDAEGRLVLCDALTYAERFKPKSVIDIATLTGACVIALGGQASGLFSNNDDLAQQLLEAGEHTDDRAWRMPIWDEYSKSLKSNFADMANIGGREAGSITAACFLAKFTQKYPWAHLDIAGTAWQSGAAKGASGRPVALLVEHILRHA